jgi:hypothetical protein
MTGEARTFTEWNEYLERFRLIAWTPTIAKEYVRLHEYQDYSAECFIYEEGDDLFLYPYLRALRGGSTAARDITTA